MTGPALPHEVQNYVRAFVTLMVVCLLACGCGSNSPTPVNSPTPGLTVAFASTGALDGGNTANPTVNIWLAKADGSSTIPLTRLTVVRAGSLIAPGAWSPDGKKLAFVSSRALDGSDAANANFTDNLWVVSADGSGSTPLTRLTAPGLANGSPLWSPDGSKLAFESNRALDGSDSLNANSTVNVWVINADGSNPTPVSRITAASPEFGVWTNQGPRWSRDGTKLAFISAAALDGSDAVIAADTFNIWTANADGSGLAPLTRLTNRGASILYPATWSPDGKKLAFESERALDGSDALNPTFQVNVWVINADGSGAIPLTRLAAAGTIGHAWSPDGGKLAFGSNRALDGSDALNTSSTENVWVMNSDGSAVSALTKLTAAGGNLVLDTLLSPLVWSLDGNKIAYSSTRAVDGSDATNPNSTTNVWLVNVDGSGATPMTKLTSSGAFSSHPSWRP